MFFQFPDACERVLGDVRSHLGAGTPLYMRFLVLMDEIISNDDSPHHIGQSILGLAEILKTCPKAFYELNGVFHPHARVEFNVQRSPITSFVLKTPNCSRIVILGSHQDHLSLHNLSTSQLCDIFIHGRTGNHTFDDLQAITDSALQDCLAQLAQDLLDDPNTPRQGRKQALTFLRRAFSVPPSLLLHGLTQRSAFTFTMMSDLYEGTVGNLRVIIKKPRVHQRWLASNKEIIREIILFRQLQHPNILPLLGASLDESDRYGLVTRFMKNSNIIDFLKRYPDTDRLIPVWQIMNGLQFLHDFSPPVAHRDIKGANILVDDNFVCRLSDFGLASIPEMSQHSRDQPIGTLSWMAPELLSSNLERVDLLKADIYSLGITIAEIYAGDLPSFVNKHASRCRPDFLPEKLLSCPYAWSPYLSELVSMMLDTDPSKRPSIRMLCQALEDNLDFPRTIEVGEQSEDPSGTEARDAPDQAFIKRATQEWIQKELCLERRHTAAPGAQCALPQKINILRPCAGPPFVRSRDRSPTRFALPRRSTIRSQIPRPSDHEFLHGLPTPITAGSCLPRAMTTAPPDAPRHEGLPGSSCGPRSTQTQHRPYPRNPARLIIPTPRKFSPITFPPKPSHHDPGRPPDILSPETPKRCRWSFSDDEGDSGEENIVLPSRQRFLQRVLRSPSPSKRRRHDSLPRSTPKTWGEGELETDSISKPRYHQHGCDRVDNIDWALGVQPASPLDIQVFVNHSSHISAPDITLAYPLPTPVAPPLNGHSSSPSNPDPQVLNRRSRIALTTAIHRAPDLVRPSSLSPPSVTAPQIMPSTRAPSWLSLGSQEHPVVIPVSSSPGSLTGSPLSSSATSPTRSSLGIPIRSGNGENDNIPPTRFSEPPSDVHAPPDPSNYHRGPCEAPCPEVGEFQPTRSLSFVQPASQSPPSTFSQGSSTSSQSSSTTLVDHAGVLTTEGKQKDSTAQSLQKTESDPIQLNLPKLEDGSPLPFSSDSGFFGHSHHFVMSHSTMWSVGTQHQHYHGHVNVLERLTTYSMSGAEFDSRRREYPPRCHPGTRDGILTDIRASLRTIGQQAQMVWISGPAGAGRSAIMQTLAETMPRDSLFAALFLSRNGGLNEAIQVFPTIAYQLAVRSGPYRSYLEEQFGADPMFLDRSLGTQFHSLFVVPFAQRRIPLGPECYPIFVDGLEECQTERDQCKILELVYGFVLEHPTIPIIWVFATRMKQHLKAIFSRARTELASYREYHLSISSNQARGDVKRYLEDEFKRIRATFAEVIPSSSPWPTQEQLLRIASASLGFFGFASSIIHFIGDPLGNPVLHFHRVLDFLDGIGPPPSSPSMESPFRNLDTLYTQMMSDVPLDLLPQIKLLLGYYMSPVVPNSMKGSLLFACNILGLGPLIDGALQALSSVLALPSPSNKHNEGVRFLHRSFADYLRDRSRSSAYWVDPDLTLSVLRRCHARIWLQWFKGRSTDGIQLSWAADTDVAQLGSGHDLRSEMFNHVSSLWTVLFHRHYHRRPLFGVDDVRPRQSCRELLNRQ